MDAKEALDEHYKFLNEHPEKVTEAKERTLRDSIILLLQERNKEFNKLSDEKKEKLIRSEIDKENILNADNIFIPLIEEVHRKVQGEDLTIKTILLHGAGIFVENAKKTSYNLLVNANSGAGKDHITDNTLQIFPMCNVQKKSAISPKAFVYWHNSKAEPNWTWDNQICYLQDTSNDIINSETFKVFCSEGSSVTVVIEHKAVELTIRGKPVLILTTASVELENELLRRMTCINLDESVEQTQLIINKQSSEACGLMFDQEYPRKIIHDELSLLKRVKVIIPFAEELQHIFPSDSIIARTHYRRMLDLIKACAAFHQVKRKWIGDGIIEATWSDYDMIVDVIKATTTNRQLIQLSKKQKEILFAAKEISTKQERWKISEFNEFYPNILALSKLYKYIPRLVELGFLLKKTETVEGSIKPISFYKVSEMSMFDIPTSDLIRAIKPISLDVSGRGIPSASRIPLFPNFPQKDASVSPQTTIEEIGEIREIKRNRENIREIRGNQEEKAFKGVSSYFSDKGTFFLSLPKILLDCCKCDFHPSDDEVRIYDNKPFCQMCFEQEVETNETTNMSSL